MLNLDPAKLLVIAVVAIILLGPDKLPQVARQVGGAWRSFNEFRHRMETQVRDTMPDLPSTTEIARLARSPSALLDHLSNMGGEGDQDEAKPEDLGGETVTSSADVVGDVAAVSDPAPAPVPAPAPAPAPEASHGSGPHDVVPTTPAPETVAPDPPKRSPDIIVPGDPGLN